jgi:hypothetical protein
MEQEDIPRSKHKCILMSNWKPWYPAVAGMAAEHRRYTTPAVVVPIGPSLASCLLEDPADTSRDLKYVNIFRPSEGYQMCGT